MSETAMICPYCGREMEIGLIQNGQVIYWRPGTEKKRFLKDNAFQEGAILLPGSSFLFASRVKSFLCRKCGKIIIDCSENEGGPSSADQ